jgi:phosphoglycolate phosphatase-like HAD superfamily hydrolase
MPRIAFDLDETLGVPLIDVTAFVGWQLRPGAAELLTRLRTQADLCIWSVSSRRYVDKAMAFGLDRWFSESYSWDELPCSWKDVRRIKADLLIDDSPHHLEAARAFNFANAYVVVPAYGSSEDTVDPLGWVQIIDAAISRCINPTVP